MISTGTNPSSVAYEQPEHTMDEIRRRYRFVAIAGLSMDIVILAAIWLLNSIPQEILLVITIVMLATGFTLAYLFIKIFPDRIARSRGLL